MDFLEQHTHEQEAVLFYENSGRNSLPSYVQNDERGMEHKRVLEGSFDWELGLHAKLCLIFSRRGVLPSKLSFSTVQERKGSFYVEFDATTDQFISIVRELQKTIGVYPDLKNFSNSWKRN